MNNLTTILLLGVLIFVIYCLMGTAKTPLPENFTNDNNNDDNDDTNEETNVPTQNNTNNAVTESRMNQNVMPTNNVVSNNNVSSHGEVATTGSLTHISSTFDYAADDNEPVVGASLDQAFEKPLPADTNTDTVDLNKNNVKNYNAKDFLPKELNDDWFNTDFSQAKYMMNDDKLINVDKYVIGVNTVGSSLRAASYDIRGGISVPKFTVSPWANSTIEPDFNIKPLC
jgi:hypothetical protein